MRKILLDTNAYSHFLSGNLKLLDIISTADLLWMSVVVLGELYTGFKGGSKEGENVAYLNRFLAQPSVQILSVSQETALIFAQIKHDLRRAGNPIPIHDVWIAAHAMETGAVLLTYDKHFERIAGLRVWSGV